VTRLHLSGAAASPFPSAFRNRGRKSRSQPFPPSMRIAPRGSGTPREIPGPYPPRLSPVPSLLPAIRPLWPTLNPYDPRLIKRPVLCRRARRDRQRLPGPGLDAPQAAYLRQDQNNCEGRCDCLKPVSDFPAGHALLLRNGLLNHTSWRGFCIVLLPGCWLYGWAADVGANWYATQPSNMT